MTTTTIQSSDLLSEAANMHDAVKANDRRLLASDIVQVVPRLRWWAFVLGFAAAGLAAWAPQKMEVPDIFSWMRYPSSMPVLALAGFGLTLAAVRLFQMAAWRLTSDRWHVDAKSHLEARLASDAVEATPEALREGNLKDSCDCLRWAVAFPNWLLFAICFALLIGAVPMFLIHLQKLGRQTDLLPAVWLPASIMLVASWIWLCAICSSALGKVAVYHWYVRMSEHLGIDYAETAITQMPHDIGTVTPIDHRLFDEFGDPVPSGHGMPESPVDGPARDPTEPMVEDGTEYPTYQVDAPPVQNNKQRPPPRTPDFHDDSDFDPLGM